MDPLPESSAPSSENTANESHSRSSQFTHFRSLSCVNVAVSAILHNRSEGSVEGDHNLVEADQRPHDAPSKFLNAFAAASVRGYETIAVTMTSESKPVRQQNTQSDSSTKFALFSHGLVHDLTICVSFDSFDNSTIHDSVKKSPEGSKTERPTSVFRIEASPTFKNLLKKFVKTFTGLGSSGSESTKKTNEPESKATTLQFALNSKYAPKPSSDKYCLDGPKKLPMGTSWLTSLAGKLESGHIERWECLS